ncbi:hypothetical protein MJT46_010554 [Ovis ammon polii x Ovis aries]|nr:hypothetical protein MJT46_010554 [Ovis ammon polii x Ovis aries]
MVKNLRSNAGIPQTLTTSITSPAMLCCNNELCVGQPLRCEDWHVDLVHTERVMEAMGRDEAQESVTCGKKSTGRREASSQKVFCKCSRGDLLPQAVPPEVGGLFRERFLESDPCNSGAVFTGTSHLSLDWTELQRTLSLCQHLQNTSVKDIQRLFRLRLFRSYQELSQTDSCFFNSIKSTESSSIVYILSTVPWANLVILGCPVSTFFCPQPPNFSQVHGLVAAVFQVFVLFAFSIDVSLLHSIFVNELIKGRYEMQREGDLGEVMCFCSDESSSPREKTCDSQCFRVPACLVMRVGIGIDEICLQVIFMESLHISENNSSNFTEKY